MLLNLLLWACDGPISSDTSKPKQEVVPNMKNIPEVVFYDRMQMILPDPLVVEKNQRPYFMS